MKKIYYIEFLRFICAITVIIDHVAITAIHMYESSSSVSDKFLYYGLQHWSHFAVPVFLMISGFLLLNPEKKIGYDKVFKKYVKRMLIILLTIGIFFALLEDIFTYHQLSPLCLIRSFTAVFEDRSWGHMWYLYMLIGIYLVLPIFKSAYETMNGNAFNMFLVLLFAFSSVMPTFAFYTGIECGIKFPVVSVFLFYFLFGRWALDEKNAPRIKPILLIAITILVMTIPIGVSYLEYYHNYSSFSTLAGYSSPIIVGIATLIVWSCKALGGVNVFTKVVLHFAENSFGIYIFHMLYINLIYKFFHYNPIEHNAMYIIVLIMIILILSDITTILFKKMPIVGSSV